MKKILVVSLLLSLLLSLTCSFAIAQDNPQPTTPAKSPVDEARQAIATKRHKAMVDKAQDLLEEKEQLEKRLKDINDKLQKLEEGKDVEVSSSSSSFSNVTWSSGPTTGGSNVWYGVSGTTLGTLGTTANLVSPSNCLTWTGTNYSAAHC